MKITDFYIITRVPFMLVTFFFVLAVFLGIIIWIWLKGDSNAIRKMPIIFAAVHFILIVIFSIIVLVWTKFDGEAGVAWRTFSLLDWPTSLFIKNTYNNELYQKIWESIVKLPIIRIIPHAIIGNILIPFISFGIFGTAQYYIWGLIISKIFLFLKK